MDHSNIVLKCSFLGDFSVGKTSLINRYEKNTFNGAYLPTIGADFTTIPLKIDGQKDIADFTNHNKYILDQSNITIKEFMDFNSKIKKINEIYIWDLAGQPLLDALRARFLVQTFLTVIVVDLYRLDTFKIDRWIEFITKYCPDSQIILVGNKSDLVDLDNSDLNNKIQKLEQEYHLPVNITSALDGSGIKELFTLVKLNIMKRIYSNNSSENNFS